MWPFTKSPDKLKYLIVVVDYFAKWIEAEPLPCIPWRRVIKFTWKNIVTRFKISEILISDNKLQFAENAFR